MKRLFILALFLLACGFVARDMDRYRPAGLVAGYSFNDASGRDASGYGATMTANLGASFVSGYASLDGSDDYTEASADNNEADLNTNSLTVTAWVQRTSGTGTATILQKGRTLYTGLGYKYWAIRTLGTSFAVKISDGTNSPLFNSGVNISDGNWHFVCARMNGSSNTLSLKVDGNAATETSATAFGDCSNSYPLHIGRSRATDGSFTTLVEQWAGNIDDVRVMQGWLSDQQLEQLYLSGRTPR